MRIGLVRVLFIILFFGDHSMQRKYFALLVVAAVVLAVFLLWRQPEPTPQFNVNKQKPIPENRDTIPTGTEAIE